MNYNETLDFLYTQLPMYSRVGAAAYKSDLNNIKALCTLLNHPEKRIRSIHIAGTNGKGSTSHMLAAILQSAGYKTGLYTSPHLKDFRERIRINGTMIAQSDVIDFVERYRQEAVQIGCSFFEWTVGLAFDHFVTNRVDVAVIETGLGGRLDSTNIITPEISVITNISWDHADLLGDTLEKIATEKAGIIKEGVPVVIGNKSGVAELFMEKAAAVHAPLIFAGDQRTVVAATQEADGQNVTVQYGNDRWTLHLDLSGICQKENVVTVLAACDELDKAGYHLTEQIIAEGLSRVKQLTGLRGRWEVLGTQPLIIADVAHNEAGLNLSMQQLMQTSHEKLHLVLGFVKEKSLDSILPLFPASAYCYFCQPYIPRALDAATLKKQAASYGLTGNAYDSVDEAMQAAKHCAGVHDLIYAGGSTFVVAEVI